MRGGLGRLEIFVLGSVRAMAADGAAIELPSSSQRRLLGLLAIHSPRRLRGEWLADELGVSLGALRTSVSRLRTSIGTDALVTTATGYALVAEVDAERFTACVAEAATAPDRIGALQQALSLWSGPALEEFQGEEWADGEIARLTEIQAGTVDDLGEALVDAGRSAQAVALLERQVVDHPYRDRSRGLLIRALACGGRQGDALRAFQDYRTQLVEELGIEPSPDVARIERRIATGWTGTETDQRADVPGDRLDLPLPRLLAPEVRFVGRSSELTTLTDALAVAASKLTGVVLTGESGIGKTSLLSTFAGSVATTSGATVLYGRCEETGVPMEPFGSILRLVVEHAPREMLTGHVARCGGELVHVCPALRTRVETSPEPSRSDTATERFLLFEAATDLLSRIAARQPLVVMLDDLQWAEPTALLLMRHLVRSLADEPILFVLACRDPEEHGREELRMALAEVQRAGVHRVELTGLGHDDLAELAASAMQGSSRADVDEVAGALQRDTAGNPLYATQLIQHWNDAGAEDLPTSLRDLVWSRVHALGGEVPDVLTSAAVLGTEFEEDVLSDMVDLPEPIVGDAIDRAVAAGLLYDTGSVQRSMRFVHSLVVSALYSDLGGSRRARLHERAARALEKRFDQVPPHVVVQLARHTSLSGQSGDALKWATRAGDQAGTAQLAPIEAAAHFRAAVELATALDRPAAERADLLVRLGEAEHRAGDPQALETLERGATLARSTGADGTTIRAAIAADRGFMRVDTQGTTYLDLVEAAVEVADPSDVATYAQLLALLSQDLLYTPESHRRFAVATEALELATGSGDPVLLARIAAPILFALWAPGSGPLRTRIAAQAGAAAEASGDPRLEFALQYTTYDVAIETADHVAAARSLAKARAIARDLREPRMLWTVSLFDTFEATMGGRLEEAEALANRGLELGLQIGEADAFTIFAGQFYTLSTFAGRHADLLPLVEQTVRDNPDMIPFQSAYAILCAAVGRTDDAQAWLDEGIANGVGGLPLDNMWTTSVISYAVLAIELDDRAAAAELLPVITPHADEVAFNGVTSQGPIAAYVGKLASLVGEHDLAEDHLHAALATANAFGWTYHRATTLFALGQARHRRLGRLDDEATSYLAESAELCRARGFASWLPQVEALLGARTGTPVTD